MFIDIKLWIVYLNITVSPFWEISDELSGWESGWYSISNPLWSFEETTLVRVAIFVYCINC